MHTIQVNIRVPVEAAELVRAVGARLRDDPVGFAAALSGLVHGGEAVPQGADVLARLARLEDSVAQLMGGGRPAAPAGSARRRFTGAEKAARDAEIQRRHDAGESAPAIAAAMGCGVDTVRRALG